ncbi:MAG TPA: DUF418 domain-containing protein [Pseudoxanthomonas sp.]|nr:DUF418 domain-containing protein [Pseudoxanthomonas sp.]
MTQATPSTILAPVGPDERLQLFDVVRGVALLGILLMNIEAFVGPPYAAVNGLDPALRGVDRAADAVIYILVQGKFWCLFSLLFGMGFTVMSQRASVAGRPFAGLYWRRGLVLLGIGLVHALLVWSGDILVTYALVSFLLLAFRDVPGRWLIVVASVAFAAPLGLILLYGLAGSLMQTTPELAAQWDAMMAGQNQMLSDMLEGQRQAYGAGSYLDATLQRFRDFGFTVLNLMTVGSMLLAMFLLGSWLVKSGAIVRPAEFPKLYARLRWAALPLGLALMLASFLLQPTLDQTDIDLTFAVAFGLSMAASASMCLGYLAWIVRGMQSPAAGRALAWVAPAGRMALTNYLVQSIVCTLVFYGYGLGYFERLPRAWQVPFALALFAVQVLASRWWLARFRFGPMEWLWRSLTYLEPQPMRVPKPA